MLFATENLFVTQQGEDTISELFLQNYNFSFEDGEKVAHFANLIFSCVALCEFGPS